MFNANQKLTVAQAVGWIHENLGLEVSHWTVREWTRRGVRGDVLKAERIGGRVVIPVMELDRFTSTTSQVVETVQGSSSAWLDGEGL